MNGSTGLVLVGKNEKDLEFVGTIMEAMATYNYDKVTPHMFQVVTKLQAAQDPESAAMVDLILRTRIYDLGYYCDLEISNVPLNALKESSDVIASSLSSANRRDKRKLQKLVEDYDGHI